MNMVGMLRVVSLINAGEEGSQAVYPRASKVALMPPLGKEEASGSCCASILPLKASITPPFPLYSIKASCFSAVPSVRG